MDGRLTVIRTLLLTAVLGLAALTPASDARAQVSCPSEAKTSDIRPQTDRCRAEFIDVLTGDDRWMTLRAGSAPVCFRPREARWEWTCRGLPEAARCRGLRSTKEGRIRVGVMAEFDNNRVTWTCYEAREED